MRYMNWDVLLFPDGSKIPLQEFKTSCYVTEDPDLSQRKMITPEELLEPSPTLTCFVPNLPHGHPFRVSVHSWEPPMPTRTARAMSMARNRVVCFEARVLLDGVCVASTLLSQQSSWPQIIDTVTQSSGVASPEPLRFPFFHKEILTQSWWSAGETMGRVKVIIAEGLTNGLVATAFERTKNIVSFSFQHAPLHVLEESKVAWPNPGMWCQVPHQSSHHGVPRGDDPLAVDAHNQSPRGRGQDDNSDPTDAAIAHCLSTAQPTSRIPGTKSDFVDAFLPAMASFPDPFVDDDHSGTRRASNEGEGSENQYVPDQSRSITPASRNQFDELVASLSARKDITGGLLAPANTRVSSAASSPRKPSTASIEAEWRVFAHAQGVPRSVSVTTRDAPPNASLEPSDIHTDSGISEPWSDLAERPGLRVQMSPTKEVKSRKEGMSRNLEQLLFKQKRSSAVDPVRRVSGKENREGSAENHFVVSDGKRKRSITPSTLTFRNLSGGSPTRKVVRTEWEEEAFARDSFGGI